MSDTRAARRRERGDWQTPRALAQAVLAKVAALVGPTAPATIVEPTCGEGVFLAAAAAAFPRARVVGYEIDPAYAETARRVAPRAEVVIEDFFEVDWERELRSAAAPVLVVGNPPWVTNATLGGLGSLNLPEKRNFKRLRGYDALTGKSNFDVSEWMILRLLAALGNAQATLALLCKTAVARRVIEFAHESAWPVAPGGLYRIDAKRHFDAAVDAVLLVVHAGVAARACPDAVWPVYTQLDASAPEASASMSVVDGELVADAGRRAATAHLLGVSDPEWRSGLKHDCARVMELTPDGAAFRNGLGERVHLDRDTVFPLLKSSDVANGAATPARAVVVPQRALGDDTAALRAQAPRTWNYLTAKRALLAARKSSIYRNQPEYSIFGVGPYAFAPFKVAISGLYKRCQFTLVPPHDGQPVMLDDTCYFLPFATRRGAEEAHAALVSPRAQEFFAARIFWDEKRPIRKALLQKLDLRALIAEVGRSRG